MVKLKQRYSAVLMSISSLPSPYGIGGFGDETKHFIDFLSSCGFSAMQVLPFNLPDYGNSPYGSCSAFAGNYLYIDPKKLADIGLITFDELKECEYTGSPYTVDYNFVFKSKRKMLKIAFKRFLNMFSDELESFAANNPWVVDYALYMAIKESYNGKPWQEWEQVHRNFDSAISRYLDFKEEADFYVFEQYVFSSQYTDVKRYAEDRGIAIIGDIPIYVANDSVDVWKNPTLFCLDNNYVSKEVAGVPPDAFSAEGQLWGNPIYNWAEHEKTNFSWWLSRLERTLELYDIVRIDHFRGFASYYSIPANAKNAKNGEWKKGPGMKLFVPVLERFDRNRIIAEDLGTYSEDVATLLKESKIRGMRVIQFGFSGGDSTHLPHNYDNTCLAYIGTHDNNTLLGWLWECDDIQRKFALHYCGFNGSDWGMGGYYSPSCRSVIETVWKSAAAVAVIPFQDLCGFGSDARMNTPGVPKDNWRFRTTFDTIDQVDKDYFSGINKLFFRS